MHIIYTCTTHIGPWPVNGNCTLSVMRSSNPKSIATLMGLASLEDIFLNLAFGKVAVCTCIICMMQIEMASQLASSPGHSQFSMLQKNFEVAWGQGYNTAIA